MFTTLTLFIISSVTALFILGNKVGQLNGSRWYVQLHSHEFERRLLTKGGAVWDMVSHSVVRGFRAFFAKFLEKAEKFFLRMFFKIFRYITKMSDMVKGRDVPANKGSASFFLKSIDEPGKNL